MNAIYKVIWNDAIRQYQVVNELCRSRRKACSVKAVHTDGAGRSLKRSVLATAAATLIGSAALLGTTGLAWADNHNIGEYDPDIEINIGTGSVNNGTLPKVDISQLPGSGETLYINQSAFTGFASNIFNQEETMPPLYLLETTDPGADISDINLSILGAEGQPLDLTQNPLGTTGTADFYYTIGNPGFMQGYLYVFRTLNRIDLRSNAGFGQVFDVSDSKGADLKAAITGGGNITFSYNSTGEGADPGHLTLSNPDNANAYTGRTFVGYNSQGDESSPVNIYFGKDGALGSTIGTEQLQIAAQSAVHFGGENDNEAYTQTVRGLSGSGLLHLGTQATLTLNQSSSDTGLVPDGAGQIIISNRYAGSGTYNAANGSYSGSVFNVNLSDEVAGYELVFTDTASDYTGLINLTNAAVTAYDTDQTVNVGGIDYTPNALLESATLQLQSGSHLKVDGKGSVHNLIVADENTSIVFDNLNLGNGTLEIDNLSLQHTGKVEIDNIGSGLQDAADDLGYLEADEGITQKIIHVSGSIVGDEYGMVLAGDALQEKQTQISGDGVEADLYWNFDSRLDYDAADQTYSANYGLTRVNVKNGQFVLEAKEGATGETADFTAQITGSGGLRIDASGTTVTLGNTEQGAPANSYSGATTVTSGTDVILAVDNAMGNTSSLDADGNVTLDENVDQTIKGLTGSGTLTLEDGSVLTLAQSGDAILDNVLSGNGTFRVSGTGTDKTNVVFTKEFDYDGAFDFSNTVFDLDEGNNRDAAASADFNLSNSVLHLGESGGTFGNMVVNDGVQFGSTYLVIGSDTAALAGTGSLTFNSNTNIKLEGISVADDIALINFDENTWYQDFITASGGITGSGNVTLQGQNLASFTGTYAQNGKNVANTTWVVSSDLRKNGSNSLQAGALLTGIELTGGELVISGAGTLAAHVTQADGAQDAAIRFSLADDGTLSSSMTVSNTNNFTAAVSVDGGVKLSLAANNALGTTSGLTVADTAEVALNNGVSQTVGCLEGTGTVSLGSGSSFTLGQNGAASLETAVTGGANSTFTVNLGGSSNALTFDNQTAYNGRFVLQSAYLQFADNSSAEAVLGGSTFVLDDGAVFDLQSGTAGTLSGFVFDGGTLGTHQTTLADAGNAQLIVTGDVSLASNTTIEAGGIILSGASDILRADNDEGVRQVFVQYSGEYKPTEGAQLNIAGGALVESDIFNDGNTTDVVAHGTWSGSVGVDTEGKQIYGDLQLTQIDLIDTNVGLILNASDADDSSLSALVTGSGNLTLAGDITIEGDQENTYSGTTTVTAGTVTLGKTNAFGATSLLTVSGGNVAFNNQSTQIGAIQSTQGGSLAGGGAITLFGSSTQTDIVGANTGLSASISVLSGHTATIHDPQGLGTGGIGLSGGSTLILDYRDQNTAFANVLTGGGSLQIGNGTDAAAVHINGTNSGFSGDINIAANADLLASGANVDDNLGTGVIKFAGSSSTLHLSSNTTGDITIDNAFSGAGSLYVSGTGSKQHFGFETSGWGNDFNGGTLTLTGIAMRVGSTVNYGDNNAANLAQANLALNANAILEVSSGDRIDTFNNLTLSGGSVHFDGTAGFNARNDLADLHIDGTLTLGSGNIALTLPDQSADMTGSLGHDSLLSTASSGLFETLIEAEKGIVGDISNITLNNGSGKGYSGTQNITGTLSTPGVEGDVAYGLFDYGLATSGNSLGLDFKLTEVDIVRGETLVLEGDGTLGVVVKDYQTGTSGGNLEIASGSNVVLSGQNEYTGITTVRGHLEADASGLGDTSLLVVESSGTYVNAGENTVGGLRVVKDGKLILDGDGEGQYPTLAIEHDAGESSTIAGVIQGSGNLSLDEGTLAVTANAETNWQGNLALGTSATKAVLNLTGENALGKGMVTFVNNDSEIHLSHSGALAFGNAVSGSGSIYVDLAGNDFTFTNTQADLTSGSHLYLTNADFSLDAGQNAAVAGKTEIVLGSQSTLSSSGESDKNIWGLDLRSGGTIDFGQVDADGGQIVLTGNDGSSGRLDLSSGKEATVVFEGDEAEAGSRFDDTNTGSALLSGGGVFDLALFEGVKELYLDGKQISKSEDPLSGLKTDDSFSGTDEDYYQHADEDGEYDLVAKLYRGGNGSFYYDGDAISMRYGIRQIDL